MGTENNHYPEFEYAASQLSAFALSIDVFIISLKDGRMIQFKPKNVREFRNWLYMHGVRDIGINNHGT